MAAATAEDQRLSHRGTHFRMKVGSGTLLLIALILVGSFVLVKAFGDNENNLVHGEKNSTNHTIRNITMEEFVDDFAEILSTSDPTLMPTGIPTTVAPTKQPTTSPTTLSPETVSPTSLSPTTAAPSTTTISNSVHPPPLSEPVCLPDRFDNVEMDVLDPEINIKRLYPGQYICSQPYSEQRYRFGMTLDGDLVWEDTDIDQVITIYKNEVDSRDLYFELTTDATMVVKSFDDENIIWSEPAVHLNNRPMTHHPRCLSNHDCPYVHLHSDGVMVLNWIGGDAQGGWVTRNFVRVYGIDANCEESKAC